MTSFNRLLWIKNVTAFRAFVSGALPAQRNGGWRLFEGSLPLAEALQAATATELSGPALLG